MRTMKGLSEAHALRLLHASYDINEAGCWNWRWLDSWGYGKVAWQLADSRRWWMAHRASYELLVGPIPTGLSLDHLCRNRSCINPQHLEPVTIAENNRRAMKARVAA